ncbi:E3 ubiquitin-protein ligase MIB2-like [Octopus vulgaris]|uniref:E3 ubiquitin-protein ligase MIB2-like n=2 Tax=Octopus TaxID=6643 RepID=A0AA36BD77_OCTVU|nr:uncharacterized protein LOC115218458 [Octopus sinensis]CAI9731864.1 E3 ubiquitin-protein ligase MIB2-like [Octopus vulgaris]
MYGQLLRAVQDGDADDLRRLCNDFITDISVTPLNPGNTPAPVEVACKNGNTELVKIFLENGCSPNLPTSKGRLIHTVLDSMKSGAINLREGRDLISFMIKKDLQLSMVDIKGDSPLQLVAELGDVETLEIIIEHSPAKHQCERSIGSGFIPLHTSVMRGDLDCVDRLLRRYPAKFINLCDQNGETALNHSLKMIRNNVKYLRTDNGVICLEQNPDQLRLFGHQCKFVGIMEMLLSMGAEPNSLYFENNFDTSRRQQSMLPLCIALSILSMYEMRYVHKVEPATLDLEKTEDYMNLYQSILQTSEEFLNLYKSVVRLLVLWGAKLEKTSRVYYKNLFANCPIVQNLIDEVFDYWSFVRFTKNKPKKLGHLCRQIIRTRLRQTKSLHSIDSLPLPANLKEYVKLNYF